MVDVDEMMDLANTAVEDVFGRTMSYVPPGGGAAVQFVGDFQRAPKAVGYDDVEHSTYDPRVDVRQSHLTDLDLEIKQNGLVTFTAFGELQTYKITDVQQSAPGSVVLVLGRKS